MTRPPALGRVILYVRDVERSAYFYAKHFGYVPRREEGDRIVELHGPSGAANIMLHPAAKSQRLGQVAVKLVFDVEDVAGFVAAAKTTGLDFGPLLKGDGYVFSNARDPDGNAISVSSRAFSMKQEPRG